MRAYLVACLVIVLWPPGTAAEQRMGALYELSWGGLEIGRFETRLMASEESYRLAYTARTTGFLGWLFPFVSRGTSEGVVAAPGPVPRHYVGESERRAGRSRWAVEFAPDGEATRVEVENPVDEERDPVPHELRRAPDPLTLALQASERIQPGARFQATGFDGKRAVRFELACDDRERPVERVAATIPLDRVLSCTLDGELEAGRSRRWGDGRDQERRPAEVVLSRDLAPGRYWPVRVEARTRYGLVIARLIGLR